MSLTMTKPIKWPVHPAKSQISLGICPVWPLFNVCFMGWNKTFFRCPGWFESSLGAQVAWLVLLCSGSYQYTCTIVILTSSSFLDYYYVQAFYLNTEYRQNCGYESWRILNFPVSFTNRLKPSLLFSNLVCSLYFWRIPSFRLFKRPQQLLAVVKHLLHMNSVLIFTFSGLLGCSLATKDLIIKILY